MKHVDVVARLLEELFPLEAVGWTFEVRGLHEREGTLWIALSATERDDAGEVTDMLEGAVPLIEPSAPALTPERAGAYVRGWVRALPMLVARELLDGPLMPVSLVCPTVLEDEHVEVAEGFAERILDLEPSAPMPRWRARLFGASDGDERGYALPDEVWLDFLAEARPPSEPEWAARWESALGEVSSLFEHVNAKMQAVYGMRLPRHVAVFMAFHRALSAAEREAYQDLDMPRLEGVLRWFEPGGLTRKTVDGLDERLHWRFRGDPPELVSVFHGHTDGRHWGLFYDDPRYLPSGLVENYARDSAQTWWSAPTLLSVVSRELESMVETLDEEHWGEDLSRVACQHRLLTEAVARAAEVDRQCDEEERAGRWLDFAERAREGDSVNGIGALDAEGRAPQPAYLAECWSDSRPFHRDPARTREWIAAARAALEEGRPGDALTLGRDLHWAEVEGLERETRELLVDAYRALGRDALAAIVLVHHANRELRSVDIYSRE